MRSLNMSEIATVNGSMSESTGMGLITGIVGVCAALSIAPAAVAFGAGVLLGDAIVHAVNGD